eukprot:791318-Amphidinium_carterae.1
MTVDDEFAVACSCKKLPQPTKDSMHTSCYFPSRQGREVSVSKCSLDCQKADVPYWETIPSDRAGLPCVQIPRKPTRIRFLNLDVTSCGECEQHLDAALDPCLKESVSFCCSLQGYGRKPQQHFVQSLYRLLSFGALRSRHVSKEALVFIVVAL